MKNLISLAKIDPCPWAMESHSLENIQPATTPGELDWDEVYEKYFPLILIKVRVRLGWDNEESRDVAQEVIEIVFRNIRAGRFRGESSLGTYIYSIVKYQLSNAIKRESRRKTVPFHDCHLTSTDPSEGYDRKERSARLTEVISSLKPQHREVIYCRYYEGMRVNEIAERMGTSPRKVSELLHYSLKKLRKSLHGDIP